MKRIFSAISSHTHSLPKPKTLRPAPVQKQQSLLTITKYVSRFAAVVSSRFSQKMPSKLAKPPSITYEDFIRDIVDLKVSAELYEQNETRLKNLVNAHVRFPGLLPKAISSTGQMLIKDGRFIAKWLSIIRNNPLICYERVLDRLRSSVIPGITSYFEEITPLIKSCKPTEPSVSVHKEKQLRLLNKIRCNTLQKAIQKSAEEKTPSDKNLQECPSDTQPNSTSCLIDDTILKQKQVSTNTTARAQKEVLGFLGASKILELRPNRITGVIEYDYRDMGLYGVLLVKDSGNQNKEELCVICLSDQNDLKVLETLAMEYTMGGLVENKGGIKDLRDYWSSHLDNFFEQQGSSTSEESN